MVSSPEMEQFTSERPEYNYRGAVPLTSPESILMSHPEISGDNWLVTGGAGFLGANFILSGRTERRARVFNLDRLSETGNLASLEKLRDDQDHVFIRGDVRNRILVQRILHEYMPGAVVHFAAERPVDHSFLSPDAFIQTNILGTFGLLEEVRQYWESMESSKRERFRFLYLSSPEVYGPLAPGEAPRKETAPYNPVGVFAASKAACDHLVRSYHRTSGLPVLIANCTCAFGAYQFPYEPIPRIILNALEGREIPLLGQDGACRDWLAAEDCSRALVTILERGRPGETYHISAGSDVTDRDMVHLLCDMLDSLRPGSPRPRRSLAVTYGAMTANHPRYALDGGRLRQELGWTPRETLESGLLKTVRWYLENEWWVDAVRSGEYRNWTARRSLERSPDSE